jgi:hypothetical protein
MSCAGRIRSWAQTRGHSGAASIEAINHATNLWRPAIVYLAEKSSIGPARPQAQACAWVLAEPICGVDFLPTVCATTGLEPPGDRVLDGASFQSQRACGPQPEGTRS